MDPTDPFHLRREPACAACSKSKRKCSKQQPSCRRCRVQNLRCVYPATVARLPDTPQSQSSAAPSARSAAPQSPAVSRHQAEDVPEVLTKWFLEPSSWIIDHFHVGEDDRITYPDSGLEYFFEHLKSWLDQWTAEGHCPFVHARVYGQVLPSSLNQALAAWQVYRAATTPATKRRALQSTAEWAQTLVSDHLLTDTDPDFLQQLSAVQALLIYQVIGLFDGDVRARGIAEGLLSTVTQWADNLLESAATAVRVDPNSQASSWKTWALSESVRRIWIVATLTEAGFLIWKQGYAACPGSIAFTGTSGIWDASSPAAWIEALRSNSTAATGLPVFCRGLDQLLDNVEPADVDEFTQALLAYGRGREDLEDWQLAT